MKIEIPSHAHAWLVERVNKYLARVELIAKQDNDSMSRFRAGQIIEAHVHDPGRMKEILFPRCELLLEFVGNRLGARKTEFDVVATKPADDWIL
jgi:sugar fermentation stimulation protein A